MPVRNLPDRASLVQLKHQAKDLLRLHAAGDVAALQRIREFHPRFSGFSDTALVAAEFKLSDAQLALAREYGFASWTRLKAFVSAGVALPRSYEERISDPLFRRAVSLIDNGSVEELRSLLVEHRWLVHSHVSFEGGNYFQNPTLLNFVAWNPVRDVSMPSNIVSVTRVLLDAGAASDLDSINETLGLVSSGRVP